MKQRKIGCLCAFLLAFSLFFAFTGAVSLAAGLAGKPVKIAIMSDIHVYDPALGTTGPAFESYLASQDNKLEAESVAIFQSALDILANSDAQVVLIAGDLTNNGEYVNHERVAGRLRQLVDAGKQVYVINGNHDIYNPNASSYAGNTTTRVKNTSPDEFKSLYRAFGYGQAKAKDANSLSYTVDLAHDVQLIVIDSCLYSASDTKPGTAGGISGARLQWVKDQIRAAKSEGKTVFGMMHHAIVPHFSTETTLFPGFVVDDYATLQQDFNSLGLQVMFTGHFHAQDLAGQYFANNQYMLDIGTGSLVNYPVPIRFVEVTADRKHLNIASTRVTSVNMALKGAADFPTYAQNAMTDGLREMFLQLATGVLAGQGHSSDEAEKLAAEMAAKKVAPNVTISDLFVKAVLAHYQGDENLDLATKALIQCVASSSDPAAKLMGQNMLAMATDVPPADNKVTIDLSTGKATN